jgi:hypothetical protein
MLGKAAQFLAGLRPMDASFGVSQFTVSPWYDSVNVVSGVGYRVPFRAGTAIAP